MINHTEVMKPTVESILLGWDQFATELLNIKSEEIQYDLLAQIDFLSHLEEVRKEISTQIERLETQLEDLERQKSDPLAQAEADQAALLKEDAQELLKHIKPKLQVAEESYEEMAEDVLTRSQNKINHLLDKSTGQPLSKQILEQESGFPLEGDIQLRDLRDSLEAYKGTRLENGAEEVGDSIVDQLNSQVAACDSALLIDEASL